MRWLIIGSGAMGGAYGALLARVGQDVAFLDTRPDVVTAIRRQGLRLTGVAGDHTFVGQAWETPPNGQEFDGVMIWVDSNHTRQAARAAAAMLAPDGFAVTFQNGFGNVEILVDELGPRRVVGGSSLCSAASPAPAVSCLTHLGPTSVGELDGGHSVRVTELAAILTAAGLPTQVHPDIQSQIWTKFALNCAANALSAVTGLRLGEMVRVPEVRHFQDLILAEIMAVTEARGTQMTDPDLPRTVKTHCWRKFSRPSMLQHIEAGRRTEMDQLNARLVAEGQRLGIPTPYNEALVCLLKGVEARALRGPELSESEYSALETAAAHEPVPA